MKRRSLSHLLKFWRHPRPLKLADGTYLLEPTGTGTLRLIRLSEAEAEESARKYRYWAIVDEGHPVTAPQGLVRKQGYSTEHEAFFGKEWNRTDVHLRIDSGREDGEMVSVSDEEVEHISAFLTDRYAATLRRVTEAEAADRPPAEAGPDA